MSISYLFIVFLLLPVVLFVPAKYKSIFSLFLSGISSLISSWLAILAFFENKQAGFFGIKDAYFSVYYCIDSLAAFFIILINTIVLIASIFGIGYMKKHSDNSKLNLHYFAFSILHISMLLICIIQSFVPFLIFWELMAISCFLLILFDTKNKEVLRSAIHFLVQMHICMIILLVAMLWIIGSTGVTTFDALKIYFSTHNNLGMFMLFFIGFGIKAGFVPLHSWLPKADSSAPDHVAAVMSGVAIKLGLYGILRTLSFVQSEKYEIGVFLIIISLITGLYGIFNAIVQKDMKKSLAYSSIENIGIIGLGIGIGFLGIAVDNFTLGFLGLAGAILHILNHAMFKALLFLGTGNIFNQTETTNMQVLGGVIKKSPITSVTFLIGALAICGLPPFNGFISEFLIYDGIISEFNKGNVSIDVLLLVSLFSISLIGGLAIFNFTRIYGIVYLGNARSTNCEKIQEVHPIMYCSQFIIISIILTISFFSSFYLKFISTIIATYMPHYHTIPFAALAPQNEVVVVLLVLISSVIVMFFIRKFVVQSNGESYSSTWGCGYVGETHKMQYTASSFSESFEKLAVISLLKKTNFKNLEKTDVFPISRTYAQTNEDIIEEKIIDPPITFIQKKLKNFAIFKSGNTQTYVWYAFLFILALFIITFFNII